jgi:hypothetical protein
MQQRLRGIVGDVQGRLPCPPAGVAPFRSFLRRLFGEANPAGKNFKGLAWLFLGVANKDALLYDEEFQVCPSLSSSLSPLLPSTDKRASH